MAVASSTSYREAARTLGYGDDHVPVIRLIARFTATVGAGKLVSATRGGEISLTAVGVRVLPAAQRMAQAADAFSEIHSNIRFSSYPAIAGRLVAAAPDLIEGPDPVTFHDVTERNRADGGLSLIERTLTGELDIVIAPSGFGDLAEAIVLDEVSLYPWELQVALPGGAAHSLFERREVRPTHLRQLKIVCAPSGHRSRELLERVFADDQVRLSIATESANQEVLFQMAVNSETVAAILPSDCFIPRDGESQRIGPQLVSTHHRPGGKYSIYSRKPVNPATPSERERNIERLVNQIISVLSADLTSTLATAMRRSRSRAGTSRTPPASD